MAEGGFDFAPLVHIYYNGNKILGMALLIVYQRGGDMAPHSFPLFVEIPFFQHIFMHMASTGAFSCPLAKANVIWMSNRINGYVYEFDFEITEHGAKGRVCLQNTAI